MLVYVMLCLITNIICIVVILDYVRLCYVMLDYVSLCYVMLDNKYYAYAVRKFSTSVINSYACLPYLGIAYITRITKNMII